MTSDDQCTMVSPVNGIQCEKRKDHGGNCGVLLGGQWRPQPAPQPAGTIEPLGDIYNEAEIPHKVNELVAALNGAIAWATNEVDGRLPHLSQQLAALTGRLDAQQGSHDRQITNLVEHMAKQQEQSAADLLLVAKKADDTVDLTSEHSARLTAVEQRLGTIPAMVTCDFSHGGMGVYYGPYTPHPLVIEGEFACINPKPVASAPPEQPGEATAIADAFERGMKAATAPDFYNGTGNQTIYHRGYAAGLAGYERWQARAMAAEERYKAADSENERLTEQGYALAAERDAAIARAEAAERRLGEIPDDRYRSDLDSAEHTVKELQTALAAAERERDAMTAERDSAWTKYKDYKGRWGEAQAEVERLTAIHNCMICVPPNYLCAQHGPSPETPIIEADAAAPQWAVETARAVLDHMLGTVAGNDKNTRQEVAAIIAKGAASRPDMKTLGECTDAAFRRGVESATETNAAAVTAAYERGRASRASLRKEDQQWWYEHGYKDGQRDVHSREYERGVRDGFANAQKQVTSEQLDALGLTPPPAPTGSNPADGTL